MRRGEIDLGLSLSSRDREKAFALTHSLSISCKAQERNYKIITRWYYDLSYLAAVFPFASDSWRCSTELVTYLHVWWDCPINKPFWKVVFNVYNECYGTSYVNIPKIALLSILPGSLQSVQRSALCFFFIAARWYLDIGKRRHLPQWLNDRRHYHPLCIWYRWSPDRKTSGTDSNWLWLTWILFKDTPELHTYMTS